MTSQPSTRSAPTRRAGILRTGAELAGWLLAWAVAWVVLVEGREVSTVLIVPGLLLGAVASVWIRRGTAAGAHGARAGQVRGWLMLVAWMVPVLVRGGIDVARRALAPSCPVHPAIVEWEAAGTSRAGRELMAVLVSTMPGTLATSIHGTRMRIHLLDDRLDWQASMRQLEELVGRLHPPAADPSPAGREG